MSLIRRDLSHFLGVLEGETNGELREYVRKVVFVPLPGFVFPHLVFFSVFSLGISVAVLAVLIRKLSQRNLWLIKFVKTDSGTLVVTAPTTSFVVFEGGFVAAYLIMAWLEYLSGDGTVSPRNLGFMPLILGLPTLGGAWTAVGGMLYACPTKFGRKWWIRSAKAYNLVFFGVPAAVLAVTLAFILLEGFQLRKGFKMWEEFDRQMSLLDSTSLPTSGTRGSAALVWQTVGLACWWWSVGWILWASFASVFAVFVAVVSFLLLKSVKHHMRSGNSVDFQSTQLESRQDQVSFFPSVKKPKKSIKTSLEDSKTRNIVLRSALRLIQGLALLIIIGTAAFVALLVYHSLTLYRDFTTSHAKGSHNMGQLIVWCGWILVIVGGPAYLLIVSSVLDPVVDGWSRNSSETKLKSVKSKTSLNLFKSASTASRANLKAQPQDQVLILEEVAVDIRHPVPEILQPRKRALSKSSIPSLDEGISWREEFWERVESLNGSKEARST